MSRMTRVNQACRNELRTGHADATRSSRTQRRRAGPRPSAPLHPAPPAPRSLHTVFWGHHVLQQIDHLSTHRCLVLELFYTSARLCQLGLHSTAALPSVDRLPGQPQRSRDIRDGAPTTDEFQCLTTHFRRMRTAHKTSLPEETPHTPPCDAVRRDAMRCDAMRCGTVDPGPHWETAAPGNSGGDPTVRSAVTRPGSLSRPSL